MAKQSENQGAKEILRRLGIAGVEWWRDEAGPLAQRRRKKALFVIYNKSPFVVVSNRDTIEEMFRGNEGSTKASLIPIPPSKERPYAAHFMGVRWNFTKEYRIMRLYLYIFVDSHISGQDIDCAGYRYESPDAQAGGNHPYWHLQPTVRIGPDKAINQHGNAAFSDKYPAVPVRANSPLELASCFFYSLYGLVSTGQPFYLGDILGKKNYNRATSVVGQ